MTSILILLRGNIHLSGLQEFNQDCCHIVAAELLHGVLGEQPVQEVLHELDRVFLLVAFLHQFSYHLLAIVYISFPDAIAPHNDELIVGMTRNFLHVWVARDHLLLVGKVAI